MDPQERDLLRRTLELSEHNNKMLKKLVSAMRWARVWRILYWVLIIAISVGAFYYIQPYLEQLLEVYSGLEGNLQNVNNFFGSFTAPR